MKRLRKSVETPRSVRHQKTGVVLTQNRRRFRISAMRFYHVNGLSWVMSGCLPFPKCHMTTHRKTFASQQKTTKTRKQSVGRKVVCIAKK